MQLTGTRPRRGQLKEPHRLFWAALAAPGIIWLTVLFIVPFYAILAIAGGYISPVFGNPVAVWNPLHWSSANFSTAMRDVVGSSAFVGPIIVRTLFYVDIASLLCLLIAYPAAYFVARFAGRRKGLFLVLLIAPFWVLFHCEHHMFMHVPCWNLPKVQRMLRDKGVLGDMLTAPGYLTVLKAASSKPPTMAALQPASGAPHPFL